MLSRIRNRYRSQESLRPGSLQPPCALHGPIVIGCAEALHESLKKLGFLLNIRPLKRYTLHPLPEWRNWQTHRIQNPALVTAWGFKSPLRHHVIPPAPQLH